MSHLGRNVLAYAQIARLWFQSLLAYRADLAFKVAGVLAQVYLLKAVWSTIYTSQGSGMDVGLPALVSYITLATIQSWILNSSVTAFMQQRIREGSIAMDLARPVGLLGQMIAFQVGSTGATILAFLLSLPFALGLGGLQAPPSLAAGGLYVGSLGLGFVVSTLLGLLIGLTTFWILEVSAFELIIFFLSRFFGGALVPLWFFPPGLRIVASLLPFQSTSFIPAAIYTGQLHGPDLVRGVLLQGCWIVALSLLALAVWRRALHSVVIHGG
jgi:ABC-2 type transport system permease protein